MNPTLETMRAHRSIRRFRGEPVPDGDVTEAVASAQMAATSSNVQAYSLIRVRDPHERAEIAELAGGQEHVERAGAFFVVCADQRRHRLLAAANGRAYAPNLETFLVAVVDASLFAQNLALAFESQGYGICYVGGIRNDLPRLDRVLELPGDVLPLYGMSVGVPAEDPGTRPRLSPEAVCFDGRYPDDERLARLVAEYDERMSRYYAERGKPGYDWSGGVVRKFERRWREELAGFYSEKGALLR